MPQTYFLILAASLNEGSTLDIIHIESLVTIKMTRIQKHSSVGDLKKKKKKTIIMSLYAMLKITLFSNNVGDLEIWFDC